ncbi:MAG: 3-methylcrotonyl-CoA carboxylase alpha subunit [Oceanicoccus sp.]
MGCRLTVVSSQQSLLGLDSFLDNIWCKESMAVAIQRFNKILIANRGEIAVRLIKACRELHIVSVAVYSTADKHSLHVELADEAVCIGEPEAASSYLNIDRIIAFAKELNVQAIHPGYGFLAENPEFSQACENNDIVFIGPSAQSMRAVAAKDTARQLAKSLSVPTIPGIDVVEAFDEKFLLECEVIGYPLLLKAAAGGGGLGMRVVKEAGTLESDYGAVCREALQAFGDDKIIVEKYLGAARHIEVQVLADAYGHCVHLHERDCSIQRRRQKIVEESPARHLAADVKQQLCDAAVSITQHINYCGAGTLEFLLDENNQFYFLEMNTRLQVEHGVTEAVTGVDIVQWQIRIAEGEVLTLEQDSIRQNGHAIECRVCAENPELDFMPASGDINFWRAPETQRCDSGVRSGSRVSVYYDSLLAKVVSYGKDFGEANRNLQTALSQTTLLGVDTNLNYLRNIAASQSWQKGGVNTNAVTLYKEEWSAAIDDRDRNILLCAAMLILNERDAEIVWPGLKHYPQKWQVSGTGFSLEVVNHRQDGSRQTVIIDGESHLCEICSSKSANDSGLFMMDAEIGNRRVQVVGLALNDGEQILVHCNTLGSLSFFFNTTNSVEHSGTSANEVTAPMPAKIVAMHVSVGDEVVAGQGLLLLESMKMETHLTASRDGKIAAIYVEENELVESGSLLLEFES